MFSSVEVGEQGREARGAGQEETAIVPYRKPKGEGRKAKEEPAVGIRMGGLRVAAEPAIKAKKPRVTRAKVKNDPRLARAAREVARSVDGAGEFGRTDAVRWEIRRGTDRAGGPGSRMLGRSCAASRRREVRDRAYYRL